MSDDVTKGAEMLARQDDTDNHQVLNRAQKIDETIQKAGNCLYKLCNALHRTEDLTEEVEILRSHESEISELEQINREADGLRQVDFRYTSSHLPLAIVVLVKSFPNFRAFSVTWTTTIKPPSPC